MTVEELLKKFDGKKLDVSLLSQYENWALNFFHNKEFITNPNLELNLTLDLTLAEKNYRDVFSKDKGASFSAFLIYALMQTCKKYPAFSYRQINGAWYEFKNLPVFIPVAVGGKERFKDFIIENVMNLSWQEFVAIYRDNINRCQCEDSGYHPGDPENWHMAFFVGNLPNIHFNSISLHQSSRFSGRPMFYLGQRILQDDKLLVPFYAMFSHANADPFIFDLFLKDFHKLVIADVSSI